MVSSYKAYFYGTPNFKMTKVSIWVHKVCLGVDNNFQIKRKIQKKDVDNNLQLAPKL
jgi:hypothetical protein